MSAPILAIASLVAFSFLRPAPPRGDPAMVEYAGCREVWFEDVPRCIFMPGSPLLLWIDHPDAADVELHVDGAPWPAEVERVDGLHGFRMSVELPPAAEVVDVTFGDPSVPPWTLWVTSAARAPHRDPGVSSSEDLIERYKEVFDKAARGEHRDALRLIEAFKEDAVRHPQGRARYLTYLGIVLWSQGRSYDAAVSLREGVTFATKLEDPGTQTDALPLYAAVLAELGFTEAAADWAERAQQLDYDDPRLFACEDKARLRSTLGWVGLLEVVQGREPLQSLEATRALLEEGLALVRPEGACPDSTVVPGLVLSLALCELHQGDAAPALRWLDEFELDDATPDLRMRLADAEIQALLGSGAASELEAALLRLENEVERSDTAEAYWRRALRRGDFMAARGELTAAVEQYREAEDRSQELVTLAAVGVGRESAALLHAQSTERLVSLLVELERTEEALRAAREAQARKIHAVSSVSPDPDDPEELRALAELAERSVLYTEERSRLDQMLAEANRSAGKGEEALRERVHHAELELARAADVILRRRSTWWPDEADLVPRAEGELLLGLYPVQGGWFVFVQDDLGTDVTWLVDGPDRALDDPALGKELLDPWTTRIAAASKVRVLASGHAQRVDVHLLSWRGKALVARKVVVYGAELPARERSSQARRALLVADSSETLDEVKAEVKAVRDALVAGGWSLQGDALQDGADRDHVVRALEGVELFYYAGHAKHDDDDDGSGDEERGLLLPPYAGGTRAWPARLELASETMLEIPDILAQPSVPRYVVLNGCRTGVPSGVGEGMSLALAFLAAGAEEVVATPVKERDEVARAVGEALARELSSNEVSPAHALQRAQAKLLAEGEDVGHHRVWVR